MRRLLSAIAVLLCTGTLFATEPAFALKGKVAIGDAYVFNVKPAAARAEWLALGEAIGGYTLVSFDHSTNTLSLKKDGTILQISMDAAIIGENVTPTGDELRQRDKERMLLLKPALEAGQPIKGSVVILVNGKAVAQPVEFVMGRETRLDGGDKVAWLITPKLNDDGSVSYNIQVNSREVDELRHTETSHTLSMRVIGTPWGKFSMMLGQDRSFGFVPEDPGGK